MNHRTRTGLILFSLSLFGFLSHFVPHDMGISTVGAIGMLSAAYLPRHLLGVPVLITVFFVDAINGFYALTAMSFVYLGHLTAAYATRPILSRIRRPMTVAGASVISALVFYLLSNVTPMAMGYYPPTLQGWTECYINGLPFLMRGIFANLLFGGLAFGAIWLVREIRAHRFVATQRH